MHHAIVSSLLTFALCCTTVVTAAPTPATPPVTSARPTIPQRSQIVTKPGVKASPRLCPDPAVSISFRIVRRDGPFDGQVEIAAQVRNAGAPYISGPRQQVMVLYEERPGGAPLVLATLPFQNLAPGGAQSISFTRDWASSSPAEGEFPPTYRAQLIYEPDIAIDSNTNNDDCQVANNIVTRSGAEINGLFAASR